MTNRFLNVACYAVLLPMTVFAQNSRLGSYRNDLQVAEAKVAGSAERTAAVRLLLDITHLPSHFVLYAYPDVLDQALFNAAIASWQRSRVDQQIGATAVTGGTTDLVSRPSTPELVGLAMQVGGITEAVSGATATFRGNADGMLRSIAGQPLTCIGCMGSKGLKNLNFLTAFDLSRQGTQSVPTSGSATSTQSQTPGTLLLPKSTRQLSSFTASYAIYNPKDTRSKEFQDAWSSWFANHQQELQSAAGDLLGAVSTLLDPVLQDPNYATLRAEYTPKLVSASNPTEFETQFGEYLSKVQTLASRDVKNFDQALLSVISAYSRYSQKYNDLILELAGKPQLSAEYTFDRPLNQPQTHNVRFIVGVNPFHGIGLFSLNAAGSFYGSIPTGAKYGRIRDFQLAGQFDRPLGDVVTHPATLTIAGYFQYQFDPTVITFTSNNLVPGTGITLPGSAQALLGAKGSLGVVQGKVSLKMGGSGVEVPIGVTWASRTDLINATDVRGHVGLTYNFDALVQK